MHLTGEIGDRVAPRTVRRIGSTGLVALLAAALAGGTLGGSPSTAATTPGAPAMPSALKPGTETAPVFPMRTVPGFAGPLHADARVRDGDGGTDQRFNVPTPAGSTLLWGDWNRDGAVTPIVFTSGHWVVYDAMVGPTPTPSREFDYGMAGDKPVVGDFNRDGRTDVGVVRGNVWLLRAFPSAGATWRRFGFGAATDVPLTGDWNGDGRDGVGVRRGAKYYLLQSPKGQKRKALPTYTFAFGRRSDAAVTGDWDGDGADTVGVVRGEGWFLRDRLSKTPVASMSRKARKAEARSTVTTRQVTVPSGAGVLPAPWSTPAGPTGAACATASAGVANRDQVSALVKPSLLLDKDLPYDPANPALSTDPVFQLRATLLESERYLLGAQYIERWYNRRGQRYTDVLSRFSVAEQEYAVRRPAMAALTTAVAARTRAHNDAVRRAHPRRGDPVRRLAGPLDRLPARRGHPRRLGRRLADRPLGHPRRRGRLADLGPDHAADPRVRRADDRLRGQQAAHPADRVLGRRHRRDHQQGRHQGRGGLLERRPAGARGVDDADALAGEELAAEGRRPRARGVREPVRRAVRRGHQRGHPGRPAGRLQHLR